MYGRTVFSRSCALHTIARNACKFEYTIYVISKHMCMNIKFYQCGRIISAPTIDLCLHTNQLANTVRQYNVTIVLFDFKKLHPFGKFRKGVFNTQTFKLYLISRQFLQERSFAVTLLLCRLQIQRCREHILFCLYILRSLLHFHRGG